MASIHRQRIACDPGPGEKFDRLVHRTCNELLSFFLCPTCNRRDFPDPGFWLIWWEQVTCAMVNNGIPKAKYIRSKCDASGGGGFSCGKAETFKICYLSITGVHPGLRASRARRWRTCNSSRLPCQYPDRYWHDSLGTVVSCDGPC